MASNADLQMHESPLDVLSNCAVSEISHGMTVNQYSHPDENSGLLYSNAEDISNHHESHNSAASTVIYIDSKGNILNSCDGYGDVLLTHKVEHKNSSDEDDKHSNFLQHSDELHENNTNLDNNPDNYRENNVKISYGSSVFNDEVIEERIQSSISTSVIISSTVKKVEEDPLSLPSKRSRKPTHKGHVYSKTVQKSKTKANLTSEDEESEPLGEPPRKTWRKKTVKYEKTVYAKNVTPKGNTVYECNQCPKSFSRLALLKSHHETHSSNKEQQLGGPCLSSQQNLHGNDMADSVTNTTVKYETTVQEGPEDDSAKQKLKCKVCTQTIGNSAQLRAHMKSHRADKFYPCSECGAEFSQSGHLMIHKRIHTGEKPYTCQICNTQFKQVSHLKTHVRTHTKDKPYKCNMCDAAFAQNSSLKRHKRSHTGEKPYSCDVCDMRFVVKSNLVRHSYIHSGKRPYSCNLCSASFGQVIDLRRHKISHTGVKPYACDLCEAKFSRKNNLKWHRLTHGDGACYQCDVCNIFFSTPGDLRFHKRSHDPPKPYPCKVCPASFQQLCSLEKHQLIHTTNFATFKKPKNKMKSDKGGANNAVKPFSCSSCNARFSEKRNWKRHMISVHCNAIVSENSTKQKREMPDMQSSGNELNKHGITEYGKEIDNCGVQYDVQTIELPSATVLSNDKLSNVISQTNGSQQVLVAPQSPYQVLLQNLPTQNLNTNNNCALVNIVNAAPVSNIGRTGGIFINGNTIPQHQPTTVNNQTLVVSTNPDEPPKEAKPAGDCPNHSSHILTLDQTTNQISAWCMCPASVAPNNIMIQQPACDAPQNAVCVIPSNSATIAPNVTVVQQNNIPTRNSESDAVQQTIFHATNSSNLLNNQALALPGGAIFFVQQMPTTASNIGSVQVVPSSCEQSM